MYVGEALTEEVSMYFAFIIHGNKRLISLCRKFISERLVVLGNRHAYDFGKTKNL